MTDRKLLELAAKAADIRVCWHGEDNVPRHMDRTEPPRIYWNPLADDGDALRLAVTLGLSLITEPFFVRVYSIKDAFLAREEVLCDGFAATRRAIVRAAAEIGKAMP